MPRPATDRFQDLYCFDLAGLAWAELGPAGISGDPPQARRMAGMAVWGGSIFVYGGNVGVDGEFKVEQTRGTGREGTAISVSRSCLGTVLSRSISVFCMSG